MSVLELIDKKYIIGIADDFDEFSDRYRKVDEMGKRIRRVYKEPKSKKLGLQLTQIKSKLAQYLIDLIVDVVELNINISEDELFTLLCEEVTLEDLFYLRRAVLDYNNTTVLLNKDDQSIFEQLMISFMV